ncbi:MAG: glutaminyl-peptide cyclotransferase [Pseudodesulfovibrio sp.]|nr:glutaminyl-peptide cyclotransferase [Pseudodesulfovibrio sp.]
MPVYAQAPTYQCTVVAEYPHNQQTSTQGLFIHNGQIYESSGGFDHSFLAVAELETGRHILSTSLGNRHFAEGIAPCNGQIYLLTWLSGTGFIYDLSTLDKQKSFAYRERGETTEGWGLTFDGKQFIASSGTARLQFYRPDDFDRVGSLVVRDDEKPIRQLNELEYVEGMILANIWKSDKIAVIDPESGKVKAWIDLGPLRQRIAPDSGVANGIAYNVTTRQLFVTGKHWNKLFQIEMDATLWRQSVLDKE